MPAGIIYIEETDSTNNYLKQLLSIDDLEEGTIVHTDYQSTGKGQQGNSWESERGKNLLFSILLFPQNIKANEQFIISQTVSLAVADFLSQYTDNITIKWPNDIYWKDKKICGILIENTLQGEQIKDSVCGIGVNINQEVFESSAPNPVSLKQITSQEYNLQVLLKQIKEYLSHYHSLLKQNDFDSIRNKYKSMLYRKDGYYLYNDGIQDFSARIKEIEINGMLVLETSNRIERRFAFKEIIYR